MDAYENEEFDEEDAEELKTASQLKKDKVALNDASNDQDNQPLNFGNDVYDDQQQQEAQIQDSNAALVMSADSNAANDMPQTLVQRPSNPYDMGAPTTDESRTQHHKDQKRKPFRVNSQHNKRGGGRQNQLTDGVQTEGGRPLTKHANRVRVSNSQGGIRRPANKTSHSANPNALA